MSALQVEFLEDKYVVCKSSDGRISLSREGRPVHLTDSPLDIVNIKAYRGELLGVLERYVAAMELGTVVDIAGGRKSETAHALAKTFPLDRVINVDLLAERAFKSEKVNPVQANALCVADVVPHGSARFVTCSHLFQYFSDEEDYYHPLGIMKGVVKILASGGVALIHEDVPTFKQYAPRINGDDVFYAGYEDDFVVITKGVPSQYHPAVAHLDLTPIPL